MPSRHVVHVLYRFSAGGLENMLVQLINGLPHAEYRHTVVALTEIDPAFAKRIARTDVEMIGLGKAPGQPYALYPKMYRLLKRLRPDVVHTSNLAALEFMPVAAFAGVPRRIHAEHGWDVSDPDGGNWRHRLLRRVFKHFVHDFIAVSAQLHDYLLGAIGVDEARVYRLSNGVDTEVFRPAADGDAPPEDFPFVRGTHWVVGTVGRLETIKNQELLATAFIGLLTRNPEYRDHMRLAIVGAGPLAVGIRAMLDEAGLSTHAWLPGARGDVPQILRSLDCFVLPSLAEGTSCTLQEAMATGLSIVATDVGGNRDLLLDGELGRLTAPGDAAAMQEALRAAYAARHDKATGALARESVRQRYSLAVMLDRYSRLFSGG